MQRLVTTHVGVTDHGTNAIKLEIAEQTQALVKLAREFSDWATRGAKHIDERLDKAENKVRALEKRLDEQSGVIGQQKKDLSTLEHRLGEVEKNDKELKSALVAQAGKINDDIFPRLRALESHIPTGGGATFAPRAVTPLAVEAIRALAQVQDLVTDQGFKLKENNETMVKTLQAGTPYKTILGKITDDALRTEFERAFATFSKGDQEERNKRLALIHELNARLVHHFALQVA
ncbi:hypothetical protein [Methylococcus sp. EFPC2]|uniref:hypothetical protein n=1 Tax=Methylococcus sp. EFPC2 TaxID=2812648 RepID=UPI001967BB03|nr:hypothetical protein [Methylococcus sp. EFPC2]QSA97006.1 hypothetical protein JWZ97_17670 [Methylococcus sp. EFPC2]